MMKTTVKTMLVLLLTTMMLANCQKQEHLTDKTTLDMSERAHEIVNKLTDFQNKVEVVRENPHLKSGELMSKEEARWNIETLFNVTYGFPDDAYGRTVSDSTVVYLPVDASGNALLEDVVAVYDQILGLVTQFYLNHTFEEKGFLLLQLQSGEVSGNQMEIFVRAVTGEKREKITNPPINYGPFFEGDDWLYGDDLGKCGYIGNSDAAKQLENAIVSSMLDWPEPPNGYRWMTANSFKIILEGNEYVENGESLIFFVENYTEDDKCLNYLKMNFHYYGQEDVIYQKVPLFHPLFPDFEFVEDWVFLNCEINGYEKYNEYPPYLHHENILDYAERYLVPISEIPLPIDLIGLY